MSNKITCLSQCKPAGVATPENIIKYSDVAKSRLKMQTDVGGPPWQTW